jgi:hypothetical protein
MLPCLSSGRHIEFITFRTERDRMVLSYRSRKRHGDWEPVEQTVSLDWTLCNYGGKRPWFCCLFCHRRVAVLYGDGKWFLCRRCYRLPYASQQESYGDRMMEQARKIRRRLGVTENLFDPVWSWNKPKGMHWKTFWRLVEREKYYNQESLMCLWGALPPKSRAAVLREGT